MAYIFKKYKIEVVPQPTIRLSNNNSTLYIVGYTALFFEKQRYFQGRKPIIEVIGQPQSRKREK